MKNQWLTFDDVMERLGAAEFEIIELFKNGMTPINTETGEPLPYYKKLPEKTFHIKGLILGQTWAQILLTSLAWGNNDYLIRIFRKADYIRWKTADVDQGEKAPAKRQSTKDKEALQAHVKSLGKKPGPQAELARKAKKEPQFKPYTEKTLLRWIQEVHPDHTPGKPGRKKTQNK
jgi:hypothetical protein